MRARGSPWHTRLGGAWVCHQSEGYFEAASLIDSSASSYLQRAVDDWEA